MSINTAYLFLFIKIKYKKNVKETRKGNFLF